MLRERVMGRSFVFACCSWITACGNDLPPEDTGEATTRLMAFDPPTSGEFEINPPTLAIQPSQDAKVAFGAGLYLVVWSIRNGNDRRMFGTRISENGTILDTAGFYIGWGAPEDVAFANDEFLIVSTLRGSSAAVPQDIRATRISLSGQVLDPGGILIAPAKNMTYVIPTVGSGGNEFLVAWSEEGNVWDPHNSIFIARVDANGTVLDPGGKLVADLPLGTLAGKPGVAFDGYQYLVAWAEEHYALRAVRMTKSGDVLDPQGLTLDEPDMTVPSGYFEARAAYDKAQFMVGTTVMTSSSSMSMRIRRVDGNGAIDPQPIVIDYNGESNRLVGLTFDGKNTLAVVAQTPSKLAYLSHVTPGGAVVETSPTVLMTGGSELSLTSNGNGAFVVWHEVLSNQYPTTISAYGSRLDTQGNLLDSPLPMSVRANPEGVPRLGYDGKQYHVAWQQPEAFLAKRISPGGEAKQAQTLPLPTVYAPSYYSRVSNVVSGGGSSHFVWVVVAVDSNPNVEPTRALRISSEGTVIDEVPFKLPRSLFGPLTQQQYVVGSDPEGALFIGTDYFTNQNPFTPSNLFAVRISNDGVQSEPVMIDGEPCFPHSLTFDGEAYLLTCSTPPGQDPGPDVPATLHGARLSPRGELLAPGWFPVVTMKDTMFERLEATFDGKTHLLIWDTYESTEAWPPQEDQLTVRFHALRVGKTGEVEAPGASVLREVSGCQPPLTYALRPVVASTTGKTFVVWSEPSNPASCDRFDVDLMGLEIDQSGEVSSPFIVSAEPGPELFPTIAAQPEGQALVAYSRFVPEAPYHANRIRARFIGSCVCADGSACVAGTCIPPSMPEPNPEPNPDTPPKKEPIAFGGCDCRASASTTSGMPVVMVLGGIMIWRRQTRRSRRRTALVR